MKDDLVEDIGSVIGEATGLPGGATMGRIVSRYGKRLVAYYVPKEGNHEKAAAILQRAAPPFIIVGLGRCGCHVTAELAGMIAIASMDPGGQTKKRRDGSFLSGMWGGGKTSAVLRFEPVMLVGDIDETAFQDVDGLMSKGGVSQKIADDVLKLNYNPLAEGGVGHVPLFAEFLTRGLLALSDRSETGEVVAWGEAKTFLTESFFKSPRAARLVFYIFSSGGGTGAGSAAEIMRAQRYAMNVSEAPERQIYFTGVAILPVDLRTNRRRLLNTGRTLIQYFSDLNIKLDNADSYDQAPACEASAFVRVGEKESRIMPWDGMALISNDIMASASDDGASYEDAEMNANQYIAQQMFNLAAAQFSAASFETDDRVPITKQNFQAIRLDPQDLKTGLLGPYAICFSAASSQEIDDKTGVGIDKMFLRAINLPKYNDSLKRGEALRLLEGISVAPTEKEVYAKILYDITNALSDRSVEKSLGGPLNVSDFEGLGEIPVFQKCPRVIFVFTAPQEGTIPAAVITRIGTLISWLFPNLSQFRGAVVRGTTAFFTLSIYVEGSVILAPDVQSAIQNYLKLCWKQRRTKPADFNEKYASFIEREPPLLDEEVADWLGEKERYGVEVPNFEGFKDEIDNRWRDYVSAHCKDPARRQALFEHTVESTFLTHREVAAALRYVNYINHMTQPEMV